MAIIWERHELVRGKPHQYQVRSAGATRRLYTNGVFHSQFNRLRPVSGSVWDLLVVPAFFLPIERVRRVLLLGVGGGAVIQQLQYFLQPDLCVGIELDPVHIVIAREQFGVKGSNQLLLQADAIEWVKHYRGPGFDVVIDDLFGETEGEPCRAVSANQIWCKQLLELVNPEGVLVMNFDSEESMYESAVAGNISAAVKSRWRLETPLYANQIVALTKAPTNLQVLRKNLRNFTELDERRNDCRLNYSITRF